MADSQANLAEQRSFAKMGAILGNPTAIATPMGSSAGFPDYGFRLKSGDKIIDLHVEYKLNAKAQMGSMRDWIFDGNKFTTANPDSDKETILAIMNNTPSCVTRAKELLADFKKYFDPDVKQISSGMLTMIKDQNLRRAKLINFKNSVDNYQIAKINDATLGSKIIDHYKKKFKANIKPNSNANLLLMVIADQMYLVDTLGVLTSADNEYLKAFFGGKDFVELKGLNAALEVRIQPRGLNSNKPVSIDVMASFRLNGLPLRGITL